MGTQMRYLRCSLWLSVKVTHDCWSQVISVFLGQNRSRFGGACLNFVPSAYKDQEIAHSARSIRAAFVLEMNSRSSVYRGYFRFEMNSENWF